MKLQYLLAVLAVSSLMVAAPTLTRASDLTVPLAVTIAQPLPALSTVPVNQSVTINGITYAVVGILTFAPVAPTTPTPVVTPPVVTPPVVTPPVVVPPTGGTGPTVTSTSPTPGIIAGYRNANRDWVQEAVEGSTVIMSGTGFGSTKGSIFYDVTIPITVLNWTNTEVTLVLPHVAAQPHVPAVQVISPTGVLVAWSNNGGIVILPKQ